jgi:hypothetical protein
VSAVGHYLEEEGIPTAGISLVREHSEAMRPPRALWVPFMLGRPLGAPDEPAFQRRVLRAVLGLFDEPAGPVIRDFPDDAPASAEAADAQGGDACPVHFARPTPAGGGAPALAAALAEEIAQLRPWQQLAARRRGGTTVGASGLQPEQAAAFLTSFLDPLPPTDPRHGEPLGESLKHACADLRAFYEEAAAGQPGDLPPDALAGWFYTGTAAGQVIMAVRRAGLGHPDAGVRLVAERMLLPRAVLRRIGA